MTPIDMADIVALLKKYDANIALLPDDVTFDSQREILKVGETEFSLAFLRFFGKHNDGAIFKIVDTDMGIKVERVEP